MGQRRRACGGGATGARGRLARARAVAIALLCAGPAAEAQLQPANVVVLYNSQNAESRAIRDAYVLARPGVLSVDLNSVELNTGSVSREQFVRLMRDPLRTWVNGTGTGGVDRSRQIMAIATTRGLPGRILSPSGTGDEFTTRSAWASIESELTLLQQDMEASGTGLVAFRYQGIVDNPYHRMVGVPITSIDRSRVRMPRVFTEVVLSPQGDAAWSLEGLTPGEMYLVCRLDSAEGPGGQTALDNVLGLIARTKVMDMNRCEVQGLLDEWQAPPPPPLGNGFELDDAIIPPLFEGSQDFESTALLLRGLGIPTTHDKAWNFVTGPELADQSRTLVALGTYGENHNIFGAWGEPAPGDGTYVQTYALHPCALMVAYESWNGTSIYAPGTSRGGQQQALDFIARGGSFTVANVMEPFEFMIADMDVLVPNLMREGLSFAEAAWASIPGLSWQSIPVGDPLAKVRLVGGSAMDRNGNGRVDIEDLYAHHAAPADTTCDGLVNDADRAAVQQFARVREAADAFAAGR